MFLNEIFSFILSIKSFSFDSISSLSVRIQYFFNANKQNINVTVDLIIQTIIMPVSRLYQKATI